MLFTTLRLGGKYLPCTKTNTQYTKVRWCLLQNYIV